MATKKKRRRIERMGGIPSFVVVATRAGDIEVSLRSPCDGGREAPARRQDKTAKKNARKAARKARRNHR
jgi:hypothetical protein